MAKTFRVDMDLSREDTLAEFLSLLGDYVSPNASASFVVNVSYANAVPKMGVEFTSYEDALDFAVYWYDPGKWTSNPIGPDKAFENAKKHVQTIVA